MPQHTSTDLPLVAVIDSGWDRSLHDPRVLPGIGLVDPRDELSLLLSEDDQDVNGHGTTCTHLLLEQSGDVRVLPIRVFGRSLESSPEMICTALRMAADRGAVLANLSLATSDKGAIEPLYRACEYARQAGMIVVAAAAFGGGESYPAHFDNVIGVGAGLLSVHADFAFNPGDAIEVVANGEPVDGSAGKRQSRRATSFATARMSGKLVALLRRTGRMDVYQLRQELERRAPMLVRRRVSVSPNVGEI